MTGLKRCGIYIVYIYIYTHTTQHIHTYIHTKEYYSVMKEILPFAVMRMDFISLILSEISQTEKQILHDITYMWNLKIIWMNVCAKQKQTHRYWQQACHYQGEEGMGKGQIRGMRLPNTMCEIDKQQCCIVCIYCV